jgi:hypothetical protein
MKCDNCAHKEVCSLKEKYKTALEKLNKQTEPFTVELNCPHHQVRDYLTPYRIPCPYDYWKDKQVTVYKQWNDTGTAGKWNPTHYQY